VEGDPPQIWLDERALAVGVGDRSTRLTAGGFAMLELLIRRRGEMVTFEELAQAGQVRSRALAESALHTAVYRVRKAIEELGVPGAITNVRGFGYMMAADRALPLAPRELLAVIRAVRMPLLVAEVGRVVLANEAAVRRFGEVEGAPVPEARPSSRRLLSGGRELLEYDLA
jgi:hypothetical protein